MLSQFKYFFTEVCFCNVKAITEFKENKSHGKKTIVTYSSMK